MAHIRTMTIDDYDGVYHTWVSTPGIGVFEEDSREGIARYLARNPTTCFVAECDGQIVGSIMAGHDGRRGFIHHTLVLEKYRGRGIATELVRHALQAMEADGMKRVALVAYADNEKGNAFWERLGFNLRLDLPYRTRIIRPLP